MKPNEILWRPKQAVLSILSILNGNEVWAILNQLGMLDV